MTRQNTQSAPANSHNHLPDLPDRITLRDGQVVDVSGYAWRMTLGAGVPTARTIDWGQLLGVTAQETSQPVMSERAVRLVILFTAGMLSKTRAKGSIKPGSACNYSEAARSLTRWLAAYPDWVPEGRAFEWSDLTEDLFDAWLHSEYEKSRKGKFPSLVRRFYRWGVREGIPDFSAPLSAALDSLRLKGNVVGERVAARDGRGGPLSMEEMDLICAACVSGKGTDQDRAIIWTLLDTAIRPQQLFELRNRDLVPPGGERGDVGTEDPDVNHRYWLRVLLLKQRGKPPVFAELPLAPGCYELLARLRKEPEDPNARLFWWLSNSFGQQIIDRLKAFVREADLRSPRLRVENPSPGEPPCELMPLSPIRFRYGMATERIARGDTVRSVSLSLTHTNTSSVHIYAATSPRIADDFGRATDYAVLPLVRRMEGRHEGRADETRPRLATAAWVSSAREGVTFLGDNYGRFVTRKEADKTVLPAEAGQAEARIAEIVKIARRRFPQHYPGGRFDTQVWDARHLAERPSATGLKCLGFTTLESTKHEVSRDPQDALPAFFANVVKSWIVLDGRVSASGSGNRLNAARHLWNYISGRRRAGEVFRWSSLSENYLRGFENHLRAYKTAGRGEPLSADTICKIMARVQRLAHFLAGRGICPEIDYTTQTTSKRAMSTQLLASKELAAEQKLPAPGVLEALADIYYRLTTVPAGEVSDYTLIRISAVVVLMFTGMRLGELLTLPSDCEVEERVPAAEPGGADTQRYGLRYWVEKTRKKTLRVKWISPTAEPVVREAVRRIKDLTVDARRRAKVLEENPNDVPLPAELADLATLTRRQVISTLGYKDGSGLSRIPHKSLPRIVVGGRVLYRAEDVKAFLLSRRVPELYTFRCDGKTQMLSESLFVVFRNQGDFKRTNKCELLVSPLREKAIGYFLSPNGPCQTVFSEFGLTEEERALATNSHAFRHWLIHTAYKGGLPERLVLRYFEKRFGSDILDYIHFVPEETGPYVPDELRFEHASARRASSPREITGGHHAAT